MRHSSFSMAKKITDISGRGVGLDVVKSNIEALGGDVTVKSIKGTGTTFIVRLPLTLAIIQALMVEVRDESMPSHLALFKTLKIFRLVILSTYRQKKSFICVVWLFR